MVDSFRTIMAGADADILDALGETVTVDGTDIVALFSEAYVETDRIKGTRPIVVCRSVDVVGVVFGAQVIYGGTNYEVVGVPPDALGLMTTLVLEEQ